MVFEAHVPQDAFVLRNFFEPVSFIRVRFYSRLFASIRGKKELPVSMSKHHSMTWPEDDKRSDVLRFYREWTRMKLANFERSAAVLAAAKSAAAKGLETCGDQPYFFVGAAAGGVDLGLYNPALMNGSS